MAATAQGGATFTAEASIAAPPQYLGDSTGTVFTFTVVNTGTTAIAAVEIQRPSADWKIVGCPSKPTGWKAQVADTKCRFRSDKKVSNYLGAGQSAHFAVRATTSSGDRNRTGSWPVVASRTNSFDVPNALAPVPAASAGALTTTAYAFEVLDAGMAVLAPAPGTACPTLTREAPTGSTQDVVVCGRNRTTGTLTPAADDSSLAGTWIGSFGTFTSGPVAPTTTSRVLGSWGGTRITGSSGTGKTVDVLVGASPAHTSPLTTLTGYEALNEPPSAVDDAAATTEDAAVSVAVLANDTDPEGDSFTITSFDDMAAGGGSITQAGNELVFNPHGDFEDLASGVSRQSAFTYRIADIHGGTATATVRVTVTGVNDGPVGIDDTASVGEDSARAVINVLANDSDPDGPSLAVSAVDTTGTLGVVTSNGGGVSYSPNGQFEFLSADQSAQDTFTYTVTDGTASDTATVTVTITGVNDGPVAVYDAYTTVSDMAAVISAPGVLANDSDPDAGDSLVAGNASDPPNGDVTLSPDGSFTYTPDAGFIGTDSFTYDTSDGTTTAPATVTITVVPPNAPPTAVATSASGNEDGGAISVTLSGDDADGDALTFTAGTAQHGLVTVPGPVTCSGATNDCTATVTYTPNANFYGQDSFTFTVNDGTADSAPATATLTIGAVNDAPSFTKGADQTVLEDAGAQSVANWATAVSAGPANESAQTVSFSVTTSNDALFSSVPQVDGTGKLTYTPAPDANGSASVTVRAADDGGTANGGADTSPAQAFTITLTPVNDAPSFTPGADPAVDEDAGSQSVSGWATAISKGPANESGQTLAFELTNDNPALFSAAPALSPTGTLSFTAAANTYGLANLTVRLDDDGGTADGGDNTSATESFTITVSAVNDAPVAAAKAVGVQTNMKINVTGLLTGVTDTADTSQEPSYTPTYQLAGVTAGSGCVGCVVSNVDPTGSFDLEPPAGQTGTFTLSYTVQDSGFPAPAATSAPALITLTVSGPVIWFVDGATGDDTTGAGTLSRPFKTLSKAATVDADNSRVFLHPGTYADGSTLPNGQWLVGAGAKASSFDALMGISPPAGTIARPAVNAATPPTVQSTVTLGSGNTVRGLTLTGVPALTGNGFGTLTLGSGAAADLTLASSGQALSLTTGTVSGDLLSTSSGGGQNNVLLSAVSSSGASLGTGALSAATAEGLRVLGGAGTFGYAGTVANAGGATVSIANKTGGAVTLTGAVSDTTGPGVLLTNNGGAALSFTGGVTLSSGTSAAFSATGGGTVTVTGTANTLSSTTGTALHVADTTIGATGLTFRSISASGAPRGIVLSSTGSSGGLTVTGNGGTCTAADTSGCSGGTIASSSGGDDASVTPVGTGIVLNNTRGVSLTRMRIHDHSNYGIRGTSVANLSLTSSVINGINGGPAAASAGAPFSEGSMLFDNLTGTASFNAVAVSGGHSSNIEINNTSGSLTAAFSGLQVGANSADQGNDGLQVEGSGTATVNVTVQNSTFTSSRGDLIQYIADGSGGGSLSFTGNTLTNNHPAIATGGGGVTLNAGASGPVSMTISNNTMRDAVGNAWTIVKSPGGGSINGTFSGNTIGNPAVANSGSLQGSGMSFMQGGSGSMAWNLTNNAIHQYNNYGINLQAGAGLVAGGVLNAAISGNTISNPGTNPMISNTHQGIHVNSGTTGGDSFTTCVDFGPNSVVGSGRNGGHDVRVRQRQDTTFRLPGYAGGAADIGAVAEFVKTKIGQPLASVSAAVSGTGGGFVGTAC